MKMFDQAGEAILLAEQGKAELAQALANGVKAWLEAFRDWLGKMPTTLPPTESLGR